MGILLRCGHNLNKEYLLGQPVAEMQKHIVSNIIDRKYVDDIVVSAIEVFHRLSNICCIERLIIENGIHAIRSIFDIYVERLRSIRLRENHLLDHAIALAKCA